MGDERGMDLNLYLGVARSVQPRSTDLGSGLPLGSVPASEAMSNPPNPSDQEYSPFFPSYNPPTIPGGPVEDSEESPLIFPRVTRRLPVPEEPVELYSPPSSPPMRSLWAADPTLRETPELRFRRLIESTRRLRPLRPRLLPLHGHVPSAERSLAEALKEEEKEENYKKAANFECNICLDMAKDPIVTSCGHLFCWPCLFQWLYVHSEHKECPVCKGEVTESNMTPIYGRGSSDGSEASENGDSPATIIPPRPSANRLENVRRKNRPISRRLGEGIATSWRRLMSQEMHNRNSGLFSDGPHHTVLPRTRARRNLAIMPEAEESGIHRESTPLPHTIEGTHIWNRLSLYELGLASSDRLAALAADIGRAVRSGNLHRASTSVNALSPERVIPRSNVASTSAANQASASSTIAVIQEDIGVYEGPVEPNSAGSSRLHRRRERSNTSGSLDADEGFLHASLPLHGKAFFALRIQSLVEPAVSEIIKAFKYEPPRFSNDALPIHKYYLSHEKSEESVKMESATSSPSL